MRDILFKAKRIDTGEWAEGSYLHQTDFYGDKVDRHFIIDGTRTNDYDIGFAAEVDPDTICEYTGLTDKNGTRIFEGDILTQRDVAVWEDYTRKDGSVWLRMTSNRKDEIGVVRYDNKGARYECDGIKGFWWMDLDKIERIGNIHDKEAQ